MTSSFPEKHYITGIRADGWQLVSLHVHENEVEETHEHKGGILIHEAVPMDLCCGITHTVKIQLTEKTNKLAARYLPASGPHYIVPKADYVALFIEIPEEMIITERPEWQSEVAQEQCDKVWLTSLTKSNCLLAVECHRVIISKNPLNIMNKGNSVKAIPQMAYPTYHLTPLADYHFTVDAPASFFMIQCV